MVRTVPKKSLLLAVALTAALMLLYYSRREETPAMDRGPRPAYRQDTSSSSSSRPRHLAPLTRRKQHQQESSSSSTSIPAHLMPETRWRKDTCVREAPKRARADMETKDILPTLNFDVSEMCHWR